MGMKSAKKLGPWEMLTYLYDDGRVGSGLWPVTQPPFDGMEFGTYRVVRVRVSLVRSKSKRRKQK